jgi:hypothetical protein
MTAITRVADAQEALRLQFAEHKCEQEDTGEASDRAGKKLPEE